MRIDLLNSKISEKTLYRLYKDGVLTYIFDTDKKVSDMSLQELSNAKNSLDQSQANKVKYLRNKEMWKRIVIDELTTRVGQLNASYEKKELYWPSSEGPIVVQSMNYIHIKNALARMKQQSNSYFKAFWVDIFETEVVRRKDQKVIDVMYRKYNEGELMYGGKSIQEHSTSELESLIGKFSTTRRADAWRNIIDMELSKRKMISQMWEEYYNNSLIYGTNYVKDISHRDIEFIKDQLNLKNPIEKAWSDIFNLELEAREAISQMWVKYHDKVLTYGTVLLKDLSYRDLEFLRDTFGEDNSIKRTWKEIFQAEMDERKLKASKIKSGINLLQYIEVPELNIDKLFGELVHEAFACIVGGSDLDIDKDVDRFVWKSYHNRELYHGDSIVQELPLDELDALLKEEEQQCTSPAIKEILEMEIAKKTKEASYELNRKKEAIQEFVDNYGVVQALFDTYVSLVAQNARKLIPWHPISTEFIELDGTVTQTYKDDQYMWYEGEVYKILKRDKVTSPRITIFKKAHSNLTVARIILPK